MNSTLTRGTVIAYIGLGSNLEDPVAQVQQACAELDKINDTRLTRCSSLYSSPPMGPPDQPNYINAVAAVETVLPADRLLAELHVIEQAHGRTREVRWGARTLDLDLLLYGDLILTSDTLSVPHPGLAERSFVLYPLQEIAPELIVPGIGPLSQLLANCPRGGLRIHE